MFGHPGFLLLACTDIVNAGHCRDKALYNCFKINFQLSMHNFSNFHSPLFAVVREFCRISMEFIRKGVNQKAYQVAARKLSC